VRQDVKDLLEELHEFGVTHDSTRADRLERFRNLEPDTAKVLALLVKATAAKSVLELGTSNGYSTVWLAEAVSSTGGHLTTVDTDNERSVMALHNLKRVHLDALVELRTEDAADTLATSGDDTWDFIFLDAERPFYAGYWPDLKRVLRPGGILAVDNVISHAAEVADFRALVSADGQVTEAVIPTGAGALLVLRDS